MKYKYVYLMLSFALIFATACEQSKSSRSQEKVLDQATTIAEAYKLAEKYTFVKVLSLKENTDTGALARELFSLKKGAMKTIDGTVYKVIDDTGDYTYRASYIYLDGARLTHAQIDSLQTLILKRYQDGVTFETLVEDYNMDPNSKHGDTGPFKTGMMVKAFEDGVAEHKKGDVFKLDVPEKRWYYVVKKTTENEGETTRIVLSLKK